MISTGGFQKSFWGELVTTAGYLINRSPSTPLKFKIPEEVWMRKPANYSNLRVIRCLTYAHIKQDKLDPRALRRVMVGYPSGVKGYKLWSLDNHKFLVSKDVKFDESMMPFLEQLSMP